MWEKKVKEPPNVRKNLSYEDETVECEKKVREPPNVTKELLDVMLEPYNVRMEPSNMRKK